MKSEVDNDRRSTFYPKRYVLWIGLAAGLAPTSATAILVACAIMAQAREHAVEAAVGASTTGLFAGLIWFVLAHIAISFELSDESVKVRTLFGTTEIPWTDIRVFLNDGRCSVVFRSRRGTYVSKAISYHNQAGVALLTAVREVCGRIGKSIQDLPSPASKRGTGAITD